MDRAPSHPVSIRRIFHLVVWGLLLLVLTGLSVGCATFFIDGTGDVGGSGPIVDLPFSDRAHRVCTQGPEEAFSHNVTSTKHALDLDTSNTMDEALYAPASGTAYVHEDHNAGGFGYHINLDIGGGHYLVLAHLSYIAVGNGEWVEAGRFVGFEGCTGNCTGDHIHYGLMQGNPTERAADGVSVPMRIRSSGTTIAAADVVCDASVSYVSDLEVVAWHPDGALLMEPFSPDVWVIDRGQRHHIETETVFDSYGWDFSQVVVVSPEELDCYPEGEIISETNCYRMARDLLGTYWLGYECADHPGRFRREVDVGLVPEVMQSWGIDEYYAHTSVEGQEILSYPVSVEMAHLRDGTLVEDPYSGARYVVNDGAALMMDDPAVFSALGYDNYDRLFLTVEEIDRVVSVVGHCGLGTGCVDADLVRTCGAVIRAHDVGGYTPTLPGDEDPCEHDQDFDEIVDCEDNCPERFNPGQDDLDLDGVGDECDLDLDGDGVPNTDDCEADNDLVSVCEDDSEDLDDDGFDVTVDCDDDDGLIHPGAPELCDGLDNDCDGQIDEGNDYDFDGVTLCQGDCDDFDEDVYPGAQEVCDNGVDEDCDGVDPICESADDDDADGPGDDDDDTTDSGEGDTPETMMSVLSIDYTPPGILAPYTYIELSGEYILADGSYGLLWTHGLATVTNASSVQFDLPGVSSGDTFRFSIEFYDAPTGYLNWGCVPPAPYSTQGTLNVTVDGVPIPVALINNNLGGCEDFVTIP